VICYDVLQFPFRKVFGHRIGEHGLSGTGFADEHDMPLLGSRLLDDIDRFLLADDLIGHLLGDRYVLGRLERLLLYPIVQLHRTLVPFVIAHLQFLH